ncbi:3059_t:CDS:2 [Scutellospora calospora]|uniref:3059_t:CDS:1 n=1 Tax=Scutellospora calospora TaxID=85575 RepID=A0ACA9LM13_9GLOM|nr:3059_t:CDS:2 [Scutellospora calospora]
MNASDTIVVDKNTGIDYNELDSDSCETIQDITNINDTDDETFCEDVFPPNYSYMIRRIIKLPPYYTDEGFEIQQFEPALIDQCDTINNNKNGNEDLPIITIAERRIDASNEFSEMEDQAADFDGSSFNNFLKEIESDYKNCGSQLRMAFDNGSMIRVQPESVKRRKANVKQRIANKENDPQEIPKRKARKTNKTRHSLDVQAEIKILMVSKFKYCD